VSSATCRDMSATFPAKTHSMSVLSTDVSTAPRLCIPTEFRRIPAEFRQKAPAGTEFDRNSPEQAPECAIILT
jgi:hypothetical protein